MIFQNINVDIKSLPTYKTPTNRQAIHVSSISFHKPENKCLNGLHNAILYPPQLHTSSYIPQQWSRPYQSIGIA